MKKLLAFLLFMGSTCVAHAATPTISSVSGTIATGQVLTIAGNNMVNESKTSWNTFWTSNSYASGFEGATPSADGYGQIGPTGGEYVSDVKLMGNKSMRFHISGASNADTTGLENYNAIVESGSDIYIRMYVRIDTADGTWPTGHVKLIDWQGSSGDQVYFQPAAGSTLGSMTAVHDSATHTVSGGSVATKRWYCFEIRWKQTSPYRFTVWRDGVQVYDAIPASIGSMNYLLFGFINAAGTSSGFSAYYWLDGLCTSASRIYPASTIQISGDNGSTWTTQEPTYLSDTSVTIRANFPTLSTTSYKLRIINNRQETSATYDLNTGSLSGPPADTTPPVISNGSPSGALSYGTTSTNLAVSTDENATCRYSTSDVAYASMANTFSTTGSTSHSQTLTGLTSGSSYRYYVRCIDTSSNANTSSTVLSFDVPSTDGSSSSSSSALLTETFDDQNFATRGWYDTTTAASLDTSVKHNGASSLKLTWSAGSTNAGQTAMRHAITATDKLYVSMYWRFNTNWVGSGQAYHPHLVMVASDLDHSADPYSGIAYNYLNTYIETSALTPRLEIQDGRNISTAYALEWTAAQAASTQNRAVAGCNGAITGSDFGDGHDCYNVGSGVYWNGRRWNGTSNFQYLTWHHVESYFQMNTISNGVAQPDGILKMWIDGNLVISKTNIVFRTNLHPTMKWGEVIIAPWIGDGSPQAQTMWIDDLIVSDTAPYSSGISAPTVSVKSVSPN